MILWCVFWSICDLVCNMVCSPLQEFSQILGGKPGKKSGRLGPTLSGG